jgi:hypothetical protein
VCEQRVAIVDQMAAIHEETFFAVNQIAGDLPHPFPVRRRRDSSDLHATALQVDHEENEVPNETAPCHDLDREEIRRSDSSPVSPQERLPSHGATPDRIDSVLGEHALNRVPADVVSEVHQRAAYTRVSPTRILDRHPDDQALNFAFDSRASGAPS